MNKEEEKLHEENLAFVKKLAAEGVIDFIEIGCENDLDDEEDKPTCHLCPKEATSQLSTYYAVCDMNDDLTGPVVWHKHDDTGLIPVCQECLKTYTTSGTIKHMKESEQAK